MKSFLKQYWLVLSFTIIKLVFHLIFPNLHYWELHRDSYLYLADGRHLAWGYMEIPPLTALWAYIIYLLGNSYFLVKLFPALFGAITIFIVGAIVIEMEGGLFAQFLGCLAYLLGAYLRINMLFQGNAYEVLSYTAGAYFLVRYIKTNREKYIFYTGIIIGLGMLNKYSILLFVAGVLVGLVLTKYRKLFARRNFYLAVLVAFLIFLPNFLWQIVNRFPVVYHMRLLEKEQLQYVEPVQFIIDQFLMNFPVMFIWIAGVVYLFFNKAGRKYMLIGWIYITVIIALLILHGKNYYALGAYPALMAAGGVYLEKLTHKKVLQYSLRPVMIAISVYVSIAFLPQMIPVFPPQKMVKILAKYKSFGLLKWEDGKDHPLPQDYADMLGWEEMTQKVAAVYSTLTSEEKKHTLLFCDNYGEAGAIDYYRNKYHLPEAYSDNASFLYWLPDSLHIDNLLLVTDDQQEMQHTFIKDFQYAAVMDSITNPLARERGTLIILFKQGNHQFNAMFHQKIAKDDHAAHW